MTARKQERQGIFEYLYRDAGNFKTNGSLRLTGFTPEADDRVRNCLEWGDQFVAEQVGIPSLCRVHWNSVGEGPSELDHAFHEVVLVRPARPEDAEVPLWGALDALLRRMEAARGQWDVRHSPNYDL